ncbi:CBS domain-containing protein [Candidatus Magnetaquicoccus inordinatus]|uniref:CBS domain-containing protein n=1 Tax=Candidatus Magnetaquicoccus inordinatus TaxID=2496818 RepID=UPI00102B22AA|nr:CBS domain-containing protein [Candidatus Magnetaquicoccus inordinatus]
METPEPISNKAREFFTNYCLTLSEELNTLTTSSVNCTLSDCSLLRGTEELAPLFAAERSVARGEEDSSGLGDLHLIFDTNLSIALAGLMMMTNEEVIRTKVASRDYDEETHEGFREVASQIFAALNRLLETTVPDGGHLFLATVRKTEAETMPPSVNGDTTYLVASLEISVADFGSFMAHWLISRRFAAAMIGIPIPGSPKEMALAAGVSEDAMLEEEEAELPHTAPGELLAPQVVGSVRLVMTETPFTLKDEEKVMRGITAITQDGYRYIGIEQKGALVRVLSQSDIYQIMGASYGTGPTSPRDKALYNLPIGKFHTQQQLVKISVNGTINEAADLMQRHKLHALPVVSGRGTLRGFVPIHAILDYFRRMGKK